MITPDQFDLKCPVCKDPFAVPVTLRCGHSICASHSQDCPVCARSPQPALATNPRIHPQSRVQFIPAAETEHNGPTIDPLRPDVTLTKILALLEETRDKLPNADDDHDHDPRPRKRHKRAHSDADEPSLLSHLRSTAEQQRQSAPDEPLGQPSAILANFDKRLQEELTCQICYAIYYQPITTPCQHTFCAKCLQRSLDHSNDCPLCRQKMPDYSYFQDHPFNSVISSIILSAYPLLHKERQEESDRLELRARLNVPILVLHLGFPGLATKLHFFEPRYRLMLRRCLELPVPQFGMILPSRPGGPQIDYGIMLQIRSVRMLPDGRSFIETVGTHRFRVLERAIFDGYMVARTETISDYQDDFPPSLSPPSEEGQDDDDEDDRPPPPPPPSGRHNLSNQELIAICDRFLTECRNGLAPWIVQRANSVLGPAPSNPALFSFWVASFLPIDEYERSKLLPIRSPRLRLLLVVHWIEQLRNNWYAWLSFVIIDGWLVGGPGVPCLMWIAFVLTAFRLIGWI